MRGLKYHFLIIITAGVLLASCGGDYNRIQKSNDAGVKYTAAMSYYKSGNYIKALPLFEELLTAFRGTEKAQDVYYYYAYTNYHLQDWVMAEYYFTTYYRTYPRTTRAEECEFMRAYCEFMLSPTYSLDQTDTKKAIEAFQAFVDDFPASPRVKESNRYIDMLRSKLERKYFEIAKLWLTIERYHPASVALEGYIKSYPSSKYDEEASFLIVKADYIYAKNSVERQKKSRYQTVIEKYNKFVSEYPNSGYLKDAQNMYKDATAYSSKSKVK
jgi:outer membrane protein assembly factor BamD